MLRRLTILAIVIWLVAGIPRAMGQDWKYGPSPPLIATSTERGAVTVAVSADYSIPKPATVPYQPQIQIPQPSQSIPGMPDTASLIPSVLPPADTTPLFLVQTQPNAAPMSPVSAPQQLDTRPQEIDARLNWSLGEIGPVAPIVAADLNPPGQHLGWYGTFDIGIMKPHLRTQLTTAPDFNGPTGGPITIGASSLDWTGVPEFWAIDSAREPESCRRPIVSFFHRELRHCRETIFMAIPHDCTARSTFKRSISTISLRSFCRRGRISPGSSFESYARGSVCALPRPTSITGRVGFRSRIPT